MEEEKMKQKVTKKAKGAKLAKKTEEAMQKHKPNWREVYASPEDNYKALLDYFTIKY